MPRNEQRLDEMARAHWCAPGERLVMGDHAAGHIGATVRGLSAAPHPPAVPGGSSVPDPSWPLPTDPVRTGRFWYDEWADDPVIWGWAHAPGPDAAAAAVAGHMTGYADEAWLLLTDRRLAVSVESRFARPPARPGGLRGRVRGARGDHSDDPAGPLTTCWEIPFTAVRGLRAVPLGRTPRPEWFIRVDFTDGSAFDFRPPAAPRPPSTSSRSARAWRQGPDPAAIRNRNPGPVGFRWTPKCRQTRPFPLLAFVRPGHPAESGGPSAWTGSRF